jgi:hypothetical protein
VNPCPSADGIAADKTALAMMLACMSAGDAMKGCAGVLVTATTGSTQPFAGHTALS